MQLLHAFNMGQYYPASPPQKKFFFFNFLQDWLYDIY